MLVKPILHYIRLLESKIDQLDDIEHLRLIGITISLSLTLIDLTNSANSPITKVFIVIVATCFNSFLFIPFIAGSLCSITILIFFNFHDPGVPIPLIFLIFWLMLAITASQLPLSWVPLWGIAPPILLYIRSFHSIQNLVSLFLITSISIGFGLVIRMNRQRKLNETINTITLKSNMMHHQDTINKTIGIQLHNTLARDFTRVLAYLRMIQTENNIPNLMQKHLHEIESNTVTCLTLLRTVIHSCKEQVSLDSLDEITTMSHDILASRGITVDIAIDNGVYSDISLRHASLLHLVIQEFIIEAYNKSVPRSEVSLIVELLSNGTITITGSYLALDQATFVQILYLQLFGSFRYLSSRGHPLLKGVGYDNLEQAINDEFNGNLDVVTIENKTVLICQFGDIADTMTSSD